MKSLGFILVFILFIFGCTAVQSPPTATSTPSPTRQEASKTPTASATVKPSATPSRFVTWTPRPTETATLTPTTTLSPTPTITYIPPATQTPHPLAINSDNVDRLVRYGRLGEGTVSDVTWSPKGDLIAVANAFGIDLFDSRTYEKVRTIDLVADTLTFSPDGNSLAVARGKGLRLVDLASGKTEKMLSTEIARISDLKFSPGGTLIAAIGQTNLNFDFADEYLEVWNTTTAEKLFNSGELATVHSVDFSPDGKQLALSSEYGVSILDSLTGEELYEISPPSEGSMFSAKFLPDGKHIIAPTSLDEIGIIDIESGGVEKSYPAEQLDKIILSPDGKTLAEIGWYAIRLINLENEQLLFEIPIRVAPKRVSFSPDWQQLIIAGWDDKITIWDLKTGKPDNIFEYSSEIINLAFIPAPSAQDSPRLVSGDFNGRIRVWDYGHANEEQRLEIDSLGLGQLAVSPNGEMLAAMDGNTTASIWDTITWEKIKQIRYPCVYWGGPTLIFNPDQRSFIIGCDGLIRVYNIKTWGPVLESTGWFPHLLPDGRVIALYRAEEGQANTQGTPNPGISFWDIGTHETILSLTLEPQEEGYVGIGPYTISADGRYLAAITDVGKIYVWDTATKKLLYKLGDLMASDENPGLMAFHPYYPILATPGSGGTMKLWDMRTGKLLTALEVTDGYISSVAFSPDGRWLAAGADDGAIRVWGVGP
jgi:WD40 repeat protein